MQSDTVGAKKYIGAMVIKGVKCVVCERTSHVLRV